MVEGIERLFDRSPYPDVVVDAVCPLVVRPCTMVPFDASRFPALLEAFNERYAPERLVDSSAGPEAVNERLLDAVDDIERWVARGLWGEVLDPCLEGLSSEVLATPFRDTMFESAVYRDGTPGWKIEAYLFTDEAASERVDDVRRAKRAYLRSLEVGTVPTADSMRHKLKEIRTKGELFGYPTCCTRRFLEERRTRFETLLAIGDDRVGELREAAETPAERGSAFRETLEAHGRTMGELNPESRVIGQLEGLDVGAYFEEWSYERLLAFFRRKSRSELPTFFYAFSAEEFYPHRPRCEAATELGRRVEIALEERHPRLTAAYRSAVVLNLFSTLGFDDRSRRRRLLEEVTTSGATER